MAQHPKVTVLDYDEVNEFEDGFALTQKDNKYGIINTELEIIIPPIMENTHGYDFSPYYFNNELYAEVDSHTVIYDTLGNVIQKFDRIIPIQEAHPKAVLSQERKNGEYIMRTGSNEYNYFGSDDWGCVNTDGDTIVPFEFNGIISASTDSSFICYTQNEQDYYIKFYYPGGTNGKTYSGKFLGWPRGNCLWRETNNGFVAMNSNLEIIDSNNYDWIYIFKDRCIGHRDGVHYTINTDFERVDTIHCDRFYHNKYWSAAMKGDSYAIFSAEGIQLTDYIYQGRWTQYVSDSYYFLVQDAHYYYVLNPQAEVLKQFVLTSGKRK